MKTLKQKALALLALLAMSITSAFAAVPVIVGTTLATVQTDALSLVDIVWPIVVTIFGALLLINIFKRAASKI